MIKLFPKNLNSATFESLNWFAGMSAWHFSNNAFHSEPVTRGYNVSKGYLSKPKIVN